MEYLSLKECERVEKIIAEIEFKAHELLDVIRGKVHATAIIRLCEAFNCDGKRGFQRAKEAIEDEVYRARMDSVADREPLH